MSETSDAASGLRALANTMEAAGAHGQASVVFESAEEGAKVWRQLCEGVPFPPKPKPCENWNGNDWFGISVGGVDFWWPANGSNRKPWWWMGNGEP